MKVLYYAHEYYCNYGARTHAREFFQALQRHPRISECRIFPAEPTPMPLFSRAPQSRVARLARAVVPVRLRMQWRMWRPFGLDFRLLCGVLTEFRPELLVLRTGIQFRYIQQLRARFPWLKICVEYNASFLSEQNRNLWFSHHWRREEARQINFADAVSVVSGYLGEELCALRPALRGKVVINPNGVDIDLFRPAEQAERREARHRLGIPDGAVVLGYIGGMESFRRLPEVVSWVARLRREGLDRLFLLLVGAGDDLDRVRRCAQDSASILDGWFQCTGRWLPLDQMPSFLAAFDVGIFPFSNPYGSPQKIYEYLACGLPILGPDVPAVTGQLDRRHLPFLVHQDGSNFAENVRRIHADLEQVKVRAAEGRRYVADHFTWRHNLERILNSVL